MFTYSRADHITVIATEFKTNLVDAGVPSRKISVIPNWTDEVCFKPHSGIDARNSFSIPEDPFVVMYDAGNFGSSHGMNTILEAAQLLKTERNVLFVFPDPGPSTT